MAKRKFEKRPEEDTRYHDTWKLLKKYRDVIWSLEVSVQQVKNQFRIDYDCSIEDFLESVYMAGADLGGTDIENHARCIERSYKMLTLLEKSSIFSAHVTRAARCTTGSCTTRFYLRRS